jgi:toxin FitB
LILLDTNVVSEPLKPRPAASVLAWLDAHFETCAISTITILELEIGVQSLPAGRRRERLHGAVSLAIERFGPRVLSFDETAARTAASLFALARSSGLPPHQIAVKLGDLQIAGIAAANECSFATRNVGDFHGLGIDLIDPWSAPG